MDGLGRWRILRLHVEDGIPLTALARQTGTALRTLQRWHHLYKIGGEGAQEPVADPVAGDLQLQLRVHVSAPSSSVSSLESWSPALFRGLGRLTVVLRA